MTAFLNEDTVEQAALEWLAEIGYETRHGPDIGPGEPAAERDSYDEVLLFGRLRARCSASTPTSRRGLPAVIDEAIRKLQRRQSTNLVHNNHAFHTAPHRRGGCRLPRQGPGQTRQGLAGGFRELGQQRLAGRSTSSPSPSQPVTHARTNRRPDIVLFVNGLPLGDRTQEPRRRKGHAGSAYNQLQTYKADIPSLIAYNEALVISDGTEARWAR